MTPRQADVAFVLDGIEGVRALYAIESGLASVHFDFAVELERNGRILAEVHYALLRVMTHNDCARVFLFHDAAPQLIVAGARLLGRLTTSERDAARRRVPPPPPPRKKEILVVEARNGEHPSVLIVDKDKDVEAVVRETLDARTARRIVVAPQLDAAVKLATEQPFDLILCEARRAFGIDGLLARLPLDIASRVLVLAKPPDLADARWRLQGSSRILTKPLESWLLRERITRLGAVSLLWTPPDMEVVRDGVPSRWVDADPRPQPRRLTVPPASAPFSVLLVDVDVNANANDDIHEALRRIFRGEARHAMRPNPEEAADLALSAPFHFILCSAKAVLHQRSFLDGIAREDPSGADGVIVVAPARDVPYVKHKIDQMGRKNTVLALPIDDTSLRREVFRDHPTLAARVAVADVADAGAPAAALSRLRFRRLAVAIVDDDQTTQILFAAAAGAHEEADVDVALASSPMEAFEHVMSRPVDVLVVSATMRGDGGEPFYRVLWRLKPELKSRSVLIMAADAVPPSAPRSFPPRILERPVTRDAIGRIVSAFDRR